MTFGKKSVLSRHVGVSSVCNSTRIPSYTHEMGMNAYFPCILLALVGALARDESALALLSGARARAGPPLAVMLIE